MSKPRVEKAGSIWWTNFTIEHEGFEVQKARPYRTWADAVEFALHLAGKAAA